jgi:concanavalin A-like lectin/glucanase superfamily protein
VALESSVPDPQDAHTAAVFVAQLRRLKAWSGLTYRQLEKEAAKHGYALPHSTIASALKRESLPREELVKGFVSACGCPDETVAAWAAVRRALAVGAHSPSHSAPSAAPADAPPPRPTTHPEAAGPGAGSHRRAYGPLSRSRRAGSLARAGALAPILLVLFAVSAASRAIPDEPPHPARAGAGAAMPSPPTPVGWWRFEETGGRTALDASGHGVNLRIGGDATRTTAPPGHALISGGNGHAVADGPVIRTDAPFTITAWVLLRNTRDSGTVVAVHHAGDAPDVVLLAYDAEHTDWAFMIPDRGTGWANGDDTAFGGSPPVPGRWTHLAAVFDPAARRICLYVDGKRGSCRNRTAITRASGPLDIGRALLRGSLVDGWRGTIDDVRVFSVPLSRKQVRQIAAGRS